MHTKRNGRTHRQTGPNRQTDRYTDRPKPICSLNFFEVGGHKNQVSTECFGIVILQLKMRTIAAVGFELECRSSYFNMHLVSDPFNVSTERAQ